MTTRSEEKSCLLSLSDNTMDFIKRIEPVKFPQLWFTINILCMGLSVYMLCLIITYDEAQIGVSVFKWPMYNGIVVVLWVYQSIIPVILYGRKPLRRLYKKLEIVLVVWYSFDAFITLVANNVMVKNKGRLIVDCCVNITSYLYATVKTIFFLEQQYQKEQDCIRRRQQQQYAAMVGGGGVGIIAGDEMYDANENDDNKSEVSELDFFDLFCTCQSLMAISCLTPFCDCCELLDLC